MRRGHERNWKAAIFFIVYFITVSIPVQAQDVSKNVFDLKKCKNLFSIISRNNSGFIIAKCITKGQALTDYEIFAPDSCLKVDLDNNAERNIKTPIGNLINNHVYFVDKAKKPNDITSNFKDTYFDAAGICYFAIEKSDVPLKPRKSGFNLFNWGSGGFSYFQGTDGVLIVNPEGKSGGKIIGFMKCTQGIGF